MIYAHDESAETERRLDFDRMLKRYGAACIRAGHHEATVIRDDALLRDRLIADHTLRQIGAKYGLSVEGARARVCRFVRWVEAHHHDAAELVAPPPCRR